MNLRLSGLIVFAAAGCQNASEVPTSTESAVQPAPAAVIAPPSAPQVRDDTKNLVFSWFEPDIGHRTGTTVAEVPANSRTDVVVADLSRSPEQRQASRYVMIVDLSEKSADGSYPVVVQSRYRFNGADLSDLGPIPKNVGVIIYTTSWCGFCKRLKAWLGAENIPFESKDIEVDPAANREMIAKLKNAGMQPGGVPVTDVAGTLIKGFNQAKISAALQRLLK